MNDSAYVYDIRKRIIEVAERLFLPIGTDLKAIQEEFLLDEGDFSEMVSDGQQSSRG